MRTVKPIEITRVINRMDSKWNNAKRSDVEAIDFPEPHSDKESTPAIDGFRNKATGRG